MRSRGLLQDEDGFTTVGVVLALIITLSLIFTSAQVYRISSASATVQNVADASALAAQNEVAEFMIVVKVCDAVVLSLSLTGIVATGLGVAALCTPVTAGASEALLSAGKKVMEARTSFAQKAAEGLNRLQRALPFLAAANALSVAKANDNAVQGQSYAALAILSPLEGKEIAVGPADAAQRALDEVEASEAELQEAGRKAQEAAKQMSQEKLRAFQRDCGDSPAYCMHERADTLAVLSGAENPLFKSVDAWSFSVAMSRAKAYYPKRFELEDPSSVGSADEQARSALRKRFYAYAVQEIGKGYVHETSDSFDANFPLLPRNTSQMRETELYWEAAYPITQGDGGLTMHAWEGCPNAQGATGLGSISQMEGGGFAECPACQFSAASMGKVAAASTSIENGFEYHYLAVAEAADAYEKARQQYEPAARAVKGKASSLFERLKEALKEAAGQRIAASPPGSNGVVVLAVSLGSVSAAGGFASSLVASGGSVGTCAAVSAATLVEDPAGEGQGVIASALDTVREQGGVAVGAAGVVLDCWGALLEAYGSGQQALIDAVKGGIDRIPFASESGLGTWATNAFRETVETLGLQPANMNALKPLLVNSSHVAAADEGEMGARLLGVKQVALDNPLSSTSLFASLVDAAGSQAIDQVAVGKVTVAAIQLPGGAQVPLELTLPSWATEGAVGLIQQAMNWLKGAYAQVVGVRAWE